MISLEFINSLPVNARYAIAGIVVIAIVVIIIVLSTSKKSSFGVTLSNMIKKSPFGVVSDSAENTVVYFYMPTCPHCIDFYPTWNEVKANLTKLKQSVRVVEVDVTSAKLPDGVPEGVVPPPYVPSIVVNKDLYEGKRTAQDITKYIAAKTAFGGKKPKVFGIF